MEIKEEWKYLTWNGHDGNDLQCILMTVGGSMLPSVQITASVARSEEEELGEG